MLSWEQDAKSFLPWLVLTPAGLKQRAAPLRPGWDRLFPPSCQAYLGPAPAPLFMLPPLLARSFPRFKAFVSPRNVSSHCL